MLTRNTQSSFSPAEAPATAWTLQLRPLAETVHYAAVTCWELFANGEYHTSTVTKELALALRSSTEGGYEVELRTSQPELRKPEDLQSLEAMALQLATLYEWLVIEVAATGQFQAIRNYDAVRQTWATLAQALQQATVAEDQITPTLLQFMEQQLQDPANFLSSLRHDYLYQTLVFDRYDQPLSSRRGYRQFASFFDKLPLWFTEEVRVEPQENSAFATLQLRGTIAPEKTDVAAIARLMAQAVGPAAPPAAVPHFHYAATYVLDRQSGLPVTVNLTVYGRLAELYNKQYTLTLNRL